MAAPQVKIFFGSQTGTAERFAEELRDEATENGITSEVVDLITFAPETFATAAITMLVVSTYGDGEPSENAVEFHRWASDPRNNGALQGRRFCVMGLGDMNYTRFNNMGLETDNNLERLGAKRIYKRGVGDDSQDIEADFNAWKGGGLWDALKKAIKDVAREGLNFAAGAAGAAMPMVVAAVMPELHVFFGLEEADGAAKDICEAVTKRAREEGLDVPTVQSLSERKAVESVRKLPRRGVAVVIVDASQEGICSAGRKLIRNMSLELDSNSLSDKDLKFAQITVASSKCNNSAAALKEAIQKGAEGMWKAFDRAGVKKLNEALPAYVDAGVEAVEPMVDTFCSGLVKAIKEQMPSPAAAAPAAAAAAPGAAAPPTLVLCAGPEAKEASDACFAEWPGGNVTVQDASIGALTSAAQTKSQVVIAMECGGDGLSETSSGFARALGQVPMAIQAQFRQLKFALLAVAVTEYGNAGERASANAMRSELTQAAGPVIQALGKFGAKCVTSTCLDLQDADQSKLAGVCTDLQKGFNEGNKPAPAPADAAAPAAASPASPPAAASIGTAVLRKAAAAKDLPTEVPTEPADVRARFYFEADCAKIMKVRELRQDPKPDEGLATAEIEIEANGNLKNYGLGGTLSIIPECDEADVVAMLPLLGLTQADLAQFVSFVAAEGAGYKVKTPFPTPCTIREAIARYCDLGRAPTKKMLTSLLPGMKDATVKERLTKLLASSETLDLLNAPALSLKMHEFWQLLGCPAGGLSLNDFLLNCPRQKAREFTIASSPKATPKSITLCVSMTSQEMKDPGPLIQQLKDAGCVPPDASLPAERRFYGLCSSWITRRLRYGDKVLAKQRPSPLHLPEKDVPVIMVGSGAGVAPFRGFWEDLRRTDRKSPAALFFGCRHPDQDWLFKEEMNGAVKLGAGCGALARMQVGPKRPLTCLFTAFSRPGDGKESKYVQDLIKSNAQSVKHWIDNMSGTVYICGSTAMGKGVLEALGGIIAGGPEDVEKLRKDGRIVAEMWG